MIHFAQPTITYANGALEYSTPYDPMLVARLKQFIPASDRQWDKERRVWLIAPQHGDTLVTLTEMFYRVSPRLPAVPTKAPEPENRIIEVRYIGVTKDRGNGEWTAFGWCDGAWSVIFPETVLKAWFGLDVEDPNAATLYGVLGIKPKANESEIRKAYRRLALQWHPDKCRENGAKEMFITIQHAYEILNDKQQRARYDAGLTLEATLDKPQNKPAAAGYRSPLRCGLLLCKGTTILGRFTVSEILAWEDITAPDGKVLSTSWPLGADTFIENWAWTQTPL